jgi:protein gp37
MTEYDVNTSVKSRVQIIYERMQREEMIQETASKMLNKQIKSLKKEKMEIIKKTVPSKKGGTKIQWTDETWNIARGCTKVDADCKFCYMYRDSEGRTPFDAKTVTRTKTVFNKPLKIKEPSKIFACSLTDFFHEAIDSYRHEAWDIIRQCPQHTFQILTKRPERVVDHLPADWGDGWPNVWIGTSVGSQDAANKRIPELMKIPTLTRCLSIEPLHAPITFYDDALEQYCWERDGNGNKKLTMNLDWAILGGESGNQTGKYRYRPCEISWFEQLIKECREAETAVFVKQLGTHLAKAMKLKDKVGGDINEFPPHLQIREFPYEDSVKDLKTA